MRLTARSRADARPCGRAPLNANARPPKRRHTESMPVYRTLLAGLSLWVSSVCFPGEAAVTSRSAIVVCASESGSPWKVIAEGFLIRSTTADRTDYRIETPEHTFSWKMGRPIPGSLVRAFFPYGSRTTPRGPVAVDELSSHPFRQSVDANGEVRERAGSIALTVGPSCLAPELARWPNPTVEGDAHKSGARPSP
jgi:hypothetical protein